MEDDPSEGIEDPPESSALVQKELRDAALRDCVQIVGHLRSLSHLLLT